jgi:hypothetical protein
MRKQCYIPRGSIPKLSGHLRPSGKFLLFDNNFGFDFTLDFVVKWCWEPDQKHRKHDGQEETHHEQRTKAVFAGRSWHNTYDYFSKIEINYKYYANFFPQRLLSFFAHDVSLLDHHVFDASDLVPNTTSRQNQG